MFKLRTLSIGALTVVVCFVLTAVMRGATETFAVFLLPLDETFSWGRGVASSIYGCFMLFFGLGAPVAGRLLDKAGPGKTYRWGLVLLGSGLALTSLWTTLWPFYLTLGVMAGSGSALIGMGVHSALLSRWYHARLTTAIAVVWAAAGIGVLVTSPLSQVFVDAFGWRETYLLLGLTVAVLAFPIALLPWNLISRGKPLPVRSERNVAGDTALSTGTRFRDAIREPAFVVLAVIQFITSISMFSVNPQIVAYLIDHGFEPLTAASAFGVIAVVGTAGVVAFGVLADYTGHFFAVTVSYVMSIAGFGLLYLAGHYPTLWLVYAFVLAYGPTFGSRGAIVNALVARVFGPRELGTIIGTLQLGMGVGAAIGATLGGVIYDWLGGYEAVLALAVLGCSTALALFWLTPQLRRSG